MPIASSIHPNIHQKDIERFLLLILPGPSYSGFVIFRPFSLPGSLHTAFTVVPHFGLVVNRFFVFWLSCSVPGPPVFFRFIYFVFSPALGESLLDDHSSPEDSRPPTPPLSRVSPPLLFFFLPYFAVRPVISPVFGWFKTFWTGLFFCIRVIPRLSNPSSLPWSSPPLRLFSPERARACPE